MPNEEGALEFMEVQAKKYRVAAWKIYPQWGPNGKGYYMDDEEYGIPMIEKARELGVKVICAHRGLSLGGLEFRYSHPADIARAARRFPDVTFICYHSGFEPGVIEGPYDPDRDEGVDRLIRAHHENGFSPNRGNLYAELGSVWRHYMGKADQAVHLMGKLLKHFGERRICWGTDALWYGSPQDQIQAFRALQISEEFRQSHGYPEITVETRRRIFGLNSAEVYGVDVTAARHALRDDHIGRVKREYVHNPNPSFESFGPKTRRAFLRLSAARGGRPA
jgi:predicted TIM-barrel fold metal-dependent hydrolase